MQSFSRAPCAHDLADNNWGQAGPSQVAQALFLAQFQSSPTNYIDKDLCLEMNAAGKRGQVDVPEWKQQLVTNFPEQAEEAMSRHSGGRSSSASRSEEVVEDLFTIDGGWSVQALEDESDDDGEAFQFDEVGILGRSGIL